MSCSNFPGVSGCIICCFVSDVLGCPKLSRQVNWSLATHFKSWAAAFTNSFDPLLAALWDANIDLQLVLGPYAPLMNIAANFHSIIV